METVIGEGKAGAWADSSRCWKHVYVPWTCKSCSSCCASTQMWNRHLLLWVKFIDGKVGGCLGRTRWMVNFTVLLLLIFHKIFLLPYKLWLPSFAYYSLPVRLWSLTSRIHSMSLFIPVMSAKSSLEAIFMHPWYNFLH